MEEELVNLVKARTGHFQFESGHHGNLWLDLDELFLRPSRLRPFIDELATRLAQSKVQAVCGPLVGGAFVAQAMATALDLEFAFAERGAASFADYRIPDEFRATLGGKKVAVVDDAINAGAAVGGTLTALQLCGADPVAIGALLVGNAAVRLSAEHDLPVKFIAELPGSLWAPSKCPLCGSRMPPKNAATDT